MAQVKISNIIYDTDEEGATQAVAPKELTLEVSFDEDPDDMAPGEVEEAIAEAISERVGWCAYSFYYTITKPIVVHASE
jgi:hypothetical protein